MKATGWACDVCGRFEQTKELPEGWFVVTRVNVSAAEACSPACLCKLGRQLGELDLTTTEKPHRCGRCKKEFASKQGLGLHKTRIHG